VNLDVGQWFEDNRPRLKLNGKKGVFAAMDRLRLRSQSGFTLIELLVVIAIIGILAAIAIPQFAAYRRRGFDAKVKSDLRNASTAQEAYFTQNSVYKNGAITNNLPGYNQSPDLTMVSAATASGYVLTATATAGCASGGTFNLSSASGQINGTDCQ
jgi:prepilin-type N-terminal cleavage/methylation domain-containing protein